jgi:hypothetical protein
VPRESAIKEIPCERCFRVARLARIPESCILAGGKDHWLRGLFLSGREYDAPRRWQIFLGRGNSSRNKNGNQGQRSHE